MNAYIWRPIALGAFLLSFFPPPAKAKLYEGNLVANPSFGTSQNDYSQWTVKNNWRTNHNSRNLAFDFHLPATGSGYQGYRTAIAKTIDLKQVHDIVSDPSHTAEQTVLTGIQFQPLHLTVSNWNDNKIGDRLDATLFCQAEIKTTAGTYRAQSSQIPLNRQTLVEAKTVSTGEQPVKLIWWATYDQFAGNPFQNSKGIPLADILDIQYKWIIHTKTENAFSANHPQHSKEGTFSLQVDQAGLQYQVRTPKHNISIAPLFSHNMVLQRDVDNPIWGTADPNTQVSVSIKGIATLKTSANALGYWSVTIPPITAGSPISITAAISDDCSTRLNDILIGDVWLCSGQSNMEWNLHQTDDFNEEFRNASQLKTLRLVEVPNHTASSPQTELQANWQICTPDTVGNFSAVAYYFGKQLNSELGIPIGLIDTNCGGTRIEPWLPQKLSNETLGQKHQASTVLYNQMIHPFTRLPIKGVIWYQGESNLGDGALYTNKLATLAQQWRAAWGQGDFPFYFVQLAPFNYSWDKSGHKLPEFWAAQNAASKQIPNAGMAVINDVGNINDIHPRNKATVGERLARLAMNRTYGYESIADSGPVPIHMSQSGTHLRIEFEHTHGGLKTRDNRPPNGFEIAGTNGTFLPAKAHIQGDTILVSAKNIANPVAVRFAWSNTAEPNLVNNQGLPTSAFQLTTHRPKQ